VYHPLGTLLLQEHMLKEDDLVRVESACVEQSCSFEEAVALLGLLTEETVRVFKEHLPSMALSQLAETDPVLLNLIPPPVACRHGCIPVANLGGTLTVALADPSDSNVLRALSEDLGRPVDAVPALEADLERAVAYHYGGREPGGEEAAAPEPAAEEADADLEVESALEGLTGEPEAAPPAAEEEPEAPRHSRAEVVVEDLASQPPQVLFANRLLCRLVLEEADRVEIRWKGEAQAEAAVFHGGKREVLSAITPARAGQVIQRYRVIADMLLQSRKKPQTGTFAVKIRFEDGIVEDHKFCLNVVPIGDQEGEVATLGLASETANRIAAAAAGEEKPRRCPACGAQEVYSRFRYCPLCGVGVG